jgi:hypothetical protein
MRLQTVFGIGLLGLGLALGCGGGTGTSADAPAGPAFPSPPATNSHPDLAPFPWVFYDVTDHASVFENEGPQWYGQLSARSGSSFSIAITALASSVNPVPDATKKIDAAVFEGVMQADGSYTWTQISRAFSANGVITITATSHGDDLLHVLAVEADPSSYDTSISPAVSFTYDVTCAAGDHSACALGAQPGESCTVSPASCDGPFAWCFSPEGACTNTGTCIRTDNLCNGLGPSVCTCDGMTELNLCTAYGDHKQIRADGDCP